MARYGSGGWNAIFVYGGVILFIVIIVLIRALSKRAKRRDFVDRVVFNDNVTVEEAKALYDINKAHKRVVDNKKYEKSGRDGKLDNGRVKAVHSDDFYCLQRWCKRLEQAKQQGPETLYSEVDTIISEMNNRSNEYSAIKPKQKERLLQLARIDETLLRRYDNVPL